MITQKQLFELAKKVGFTACVPLDIHTITLKKEVRDMCTDNLCGQYNKRWSCPPGCGTLEECAKNLEAYSGGILVQTVGQIEDSYDMEAMMDVEKLHKEYMSKMYAILRKDSIQTLAIGSGCCTRCAVCTFPGQPCRYPNEKMVSMEAYGMLVLQICKDNHLPYYYGPDKIAYTGCFLL